MTVWKRSRGTKSSNRPGLPDGVRIYAVGDIHGRSDLLKIQLAQIAADELSHPCMRSTIIFLGDYIDRGPDSRGTIELLLACAQLRDVVFLKGNHELFFRRFLDAPETLDDWRSYGGLQTLASYGLRPSLRRSDDDHQGLSDELRAALPAQHLAFLHSLVPQYVCGDFVFVHAGIRPGIALARQTEEDLLWIRDDFLSHGSSFEKFVIHGHTPVIAPDIRSNRANIDTGAFATGRLSCVAIEGSDIVPMRDIRHWVAGDPSRDEDLPSEAADRSASSCRRPASVQASAALIISP